MMKSNTMSMLKYQIAFLFVSCLFIFHATGQTKQNRYDSAWKRADKMIGEKGVNKSALAEVDKIYEWARKEKNDAQLIKALLYQMNLSQYLEEKGEEKNIQKIEKEITAAHEPARVALNS